MKEAIFLQTNTEALSWFFSWGNIVFLGLAIILTLYVFLHSYFREVPALVYRLLVALPILLIIPSLIFTLSPYENKVSMAGNITLFFVLGLIGGIVPIIVSIAYAVYSSSAKKRNYCPIHNIYYEGDVCPICAADVPIPKQPTTKATMIETIPRAKGYLIDKTTGKPHTLSDVVVIGRGSHNEGEGTKINIDDPYISRLHSRIEFDGNKFKISDSSSRSGTFVNGQKIKGWVTLVDGDDLKVGRTHLKFTQSK
jgi:hypothetical protein